MHADADCHTLNIQKAPYAVIKLQLLFLLDVKHTLLFSLVTGNPIRVNNCQPLIKGKMEMWVTL